MRKLGLVVFSSDTGLGNQSRRLTHMLQPERILLIDNSNFSKNTTQHPEWYNGYNGWSVKGAPSNFAIDKFLNGLTHLFLLENPLNWYMVRRARKLGIKVYFHCNYEFCDNLKERELPLPDKFVMPSPWMVEEMKQRFGEDRVVYLPPPLYANDYKEAREANFKRKTGRQFLHIAGTIAARDRNGTLDLLRALAFTDSQFTLTIKSQHPLPDEYMQFGDSRVRFSFGTEPEVSNLYKDYDAMILPRRYGGLCLPMAEALMAGLPVIMPDISPNNKILPAKWLVSAHQKEELMTRVAIPVYETSPAALALKIEELVDGIIDNDKAEAFDLAHQTFAPSNLKGYDELW